MSGLVDAVKRATGLLDKMHVPYMVFGGIANSIYGNPRQTFDVDIKFLLEREEEMVRFLAGIASIGVILPEDPRSFMEETNVLPIDIDGVRTDLVKAELPFEKKAIARSRTVDFYGATIKVCTAEDLIIQKAVSTREKDWFDIRCIIENQHDRMNRDYLLRHCEELSRPTRISTTGSRDGWMKNPYERMLSKMELFNQWEKGYNRSLSPERRLEQFTMLFDFGLTYQKEIIEKMHKEHLAALVSSAKAVKYALSRGDTASSPPHTSKVGTETSLNLP